MRMYVILAILALLLLTLFAALAAGVTRLVATSRSARKREAVAARLAAVAEQAAQEHRIRHAAAERSSALTTVLPAIQPAEEERKPRRVA
jgi:hypothetical protein